MGLLVHQSLRPRPIYYVTTTRGVAEPGHVPEAVVEGFAARVVGLLGNLTPATAAVGYDAEPAVPGAQARGPLHAQAQEDLKRITDQQLATTFAIHQAAVEARGRRLAGQPARHPAELVARPVPRARTACATRSRSRGRP